MLQTGFFFQESRFKKLVDRVKEKPSRILNLKKKIVDMYECKSALTSLAREPVLIQALLGQVFAAQGYPRW